MSVMGVGSHLVGAPLHAVFSLDSVQRAPTIECLLMGGCGQDH